MRIHQTLGGRISRLEGADCVTKTVLRDMRTFILLVSSNFIILGAGCCEHANVGGKTTRGGIKSLLRYHGTVSTSNKYKARRLYNSYPMHHTVRRTFSGGGDFASLRTALGIYASNCRSMRYSTIISKACLLLGNRSQVIVAIRSVAHRGRTRHTLTGAGVRKGIAPWGGLVGVLYQFGIMFLRPGFGTYV